MKSPIVHFALLGLVLFVGARWLFPSERTERAPDTRIVISESQLAALVNQYEATSGMVATDEVRAELIQRFAEEEMLCREAQRWGLTEDNQAIDLRLRQKMAFVSDQEHSDEELERQARALGLDSDDAVIRNMLVHNMRLLLSTKGEQELTDAEVEAYYERERSRFARPARITGWHVFFSKDLRQSSAMAAARAAKAELDAEALEPQQAVGLGDVSPSGAHFDGKLARQLASRFGAEFAKAAESLPERQWSDPIETPFGAHLLLVQERTQPQTPPLSEIRARVAAVYKSSQRQKRLATAMEELRARYEVVVE
ncbi:MAG: peptidyl-prolyl cis-trans isomerase [Myxococcales bacterium]|nr:peptidyl-prolyl cis-trans isomerase [Myxococcales bacterium]